MWSLLEWCRVILYRRRRTYYLFLDHFACQLNCLACDCPKYSLRVNIVIPWWPPPTMHKQIESFILTWYAAGLPRTPSWSLIGLQIKLVYRFFSGHFDMILVVLDYALVAVSDLCTLTLMLDLHSDHHMAAFTDLCHWLSLTVNSPGTKVKSCMLYSDLNAITCDRY